MKIKLTFTDEMLGTKPCKKEVFATYVASLAPSEAQKQTEIEHAEDREEQGTTIFGMQDGRVVVEAYMLKGFFKSACSAMRQVEGSLSKQLTSYKSKIDLLVFVSPKYIPVALPAGAAFKGICERSIRADTAQGPRITVARSETIPAGSTLTFEIKCLAKKLGKGENAVDSTALIGEWLNYGALNGLGAWRNSGKGAFTWEELA
jgi:hypothetical protein